MSYTHQAFAQEASNIIQFKSLIGTNHTNSDTPLFNTSNQKGDFSGKAYVYPSPMSARGESWIGFNVKKGYLNIKLYIYDAYGAQIYELSDKYEIGYCKILISKATLGYTLSVGVYYRGIHLPCTPPHGRSRNYKKDTIL